MRRFIHIVVEKAHILDIFQAENSYKKNPYVKIEGKTKNIIKERMQ